MDRMSVGKHIADPCTKPHLGDRYPDYLDGLLGKEEARMITAHVRSCHVCQSEMDMWLLLFEPQLDSDSGAKSK